MTKSEVIKGLEEIKTSKFLVHYNNGSLIKYQYVVSQAIEYLQQEPKQRSEEETLKIIKDNLGWQYDTIKLSLLFMRK